MNFCKVVDKLCVYLIYLLWSQDRSLFSFFLLLEHLLLEIWELMGILLAFIACLGQ